MEPAPLGQARVDERLRPVEPPAGARQHPLHQLLDLGRAQHDGRELVLAPAGHEHPAGLVDPDLLDLGILEQPGQRPEPADAMVEQLDVLVA